MKTLNKLTPFGRFCCTIGNLPTSYMESLTYEQQLLWLCKYLEETVIPTVNNNAEAVEELQCLYIQLKTYVDNYFDSLDIQEEVNRKLDEMAQSGQLLEIITSYLNLKCILAFNNLNELKNATNLINGSFVKTYGTTSYNDGNGYFYKIREITTSDVIDDDKIVKIENSTSLIAEKIKNSSIDYLSNENIETNNIINGNGVFLGSFFLSKTNTVSLQLCMSKDGFNWTRILTDELKDLNIRDGSIIYYNNKFYIASTGGSTNNDCLIWSSDDLLNWTKTPVSLGLSSLEIRWAPEFFVDDNGDLYITITAGANTNKQLYISKCNDINTFDFENATIININLENIIDPYIIKVDNIYYLAFAKQQILANNESTSKIMIYKSTDLSTWEVVNDNVFKGFEFVEGPCILYKNNRFIIYGDATTSYHYYAYTQTDTLENTNMYVEMSESMMNLRHGSVIYLNDKNVLSKIYTAIGDESANLTYRQKNYKSIVQINKNMTNLVIQPNILYQISGADVNYTITNVLNPFAIDYFPFVFTKRTDATLTLSNLQSTDGSIKTRNIVLRNSNSSNEKFFNVCLIGNCFGPYMP